jgi:enoyl-CoA hydratase
MAYEHIIYEKKGNIAVVTLNHPQRLNALCPEISLELSKAINEVNYDDEIKVVIFKGAGRSMCAGADLSKVGFVYGWKTPKPGEKSKKPGVRVRLHFDKLTFFDECQELLLCQKITIVQAHGHLLGAGLNMFMNADLLIAAEGTKFGHVEERLGLGGATITPMMILRCGLTKALELCLTGKMIDAKEAMEHGLINKVYPADQLETKVMELAEGLAKYPRDGVALGKVSRHWVYDIMGITKGLTNSYVMHTLQTNITFEEDEFNFFKSRRDEGVKDAAHGKHDFYKALDEF